MLSQQTERCGLRQSGQRDGERLAATDALAACEEWKQRVYLPLVEAAGVTFVPVDADVFLFPHAVWACTVPVLLSDADVLAYVAVVSAGWVCSWWSTFFPCKCHILSALCPPRVAFRSWSCLRPASWTVTRSSVLTSVASEVCCSFL